MQLKKCGAVINWNINQLEQLFENIKRTTVEKDVSVVLQKTILVFSSCGGEIKVFHRSFEAIDYTFAHIDFKLQKTIFEVIQYLMYFCAKLARCRYFDLFKFNKFKTSSSFVSTFKFSVSKKSFISASICSLKESCVAVFESNLNKDSKFKTFSYHIFRGLWFWFLLGNIKIHHFDWPWNRNTF